MGNEEAVKHVQDIWFCDMECKTSYDRYIEMRKELLTWIEQGGQVPRLEEVSKEDYLKAKDAFDTGNKEYSGMPLCGFYEYDIVMAMLRIRAGGHSKGPAFDYEDLIEFNGIDGVFVKDLTNFSIETIRSVEITALNRISTGQGEKFVSPMIGHKDKFAAIYHGDIEDYAGTNWDMGHNVATSRWVRSALTERNEKYVKEMGHYRLLQDVLSRTLLLKPEYRAYRARLLMRASPAIGTSMNRNYFSPDSPSLSHPEFVARYTDRKRRLWEEEHPTRFMALHLKELTEKQYDEFKEEIVREFEKEFALWQSKHSNRGSMSMEFDLASFPAYEEVNSGLYSLQMTALSNRLHLTSEGEISPGVNIKTELKAWGRPAFGLEDNLAGFLLRQAQTTPAFDEAYDKEAAKTKYTRVQMAVKEKVIDDRIWGEEGPWEAASGKKPPGVTKYTSAGSSLSPGVTKYAAAGPTVSLPPVKVPGQRVDRDYLEEYERERAIKKVAAMEQEERIQRAYEAGRREGEVSAITERDRDRERAEAADRHRDQCDRDQRDRDQREKDDKHRRDQEASKSRNAGRSGRSGGYGGDGGGSSSSESDDDSEEDRQKSSKPVKRTPVPMDFLKAGSVSTHLNLPRYRVDDDMTIASGTAKENEMNELEGQYQKIDDIIYNCALQKGSSANIRLTSTSTSDLIKAHVIQPGKDQTEGQHGMNLLTDIRNQVTLIKIIPSEIVQLALELDYNFGRLMDKAQEAGIKAQEAEHEIKILLAQSTTVLGQLHYEDDAKRAAKAEKKQLLKEAGLRSDSQEELEEATEAILATYDKIKKRHLDKAMKRMLRDERRAQEIKDEQSRARMEEQALKQIKEQIEAIQGVISAIVLALDQIRTKVITYLSEPANQILMRTFAQGKVRNARYKTLSTDNPINNQHFPGIFWGLNSQYQNGNVTALKDDFFTLMSKLPEELRVIKDVKQYIFHILKFRSLWHSKDYSYLFTVEVMFALIAIINNPSKTIQMEGIKAFGNVIDKLIEEHPGHELEAKEAIREGLNNKLFQEVIEAMEKHSIVENNAGVKVWGGRTVAADAPTARYSNSGGGRGRSIDAHHLKVPEEDSYASTLTTKSGSSAPASVKWHTLVGRPKVQASVKSTSFEAAIPVSKGIWIRRQVTGQDGATQYQEHPYTATPAECTVCVPGNEASHKPRCFKKQCDGCKLYGHLKSCCLQKLA
jgi:hypothetical protein